MSSSLEDKGPTNEVETSITTSSSCFKIVHHDDNEQQVRTVPPVPYKQLTAPITPQDIQDIWSESFSDDDEGNITAVNKGTSNLTVKAEIHTSKRKNAKSTIEVDNSEEDDDANDEADEEDIQFLRQLTARCESVEIQIDTNGFRSCIEQIHNLIPNLYANCFDLKEFPSLADYYKQAIGTLPTQDFLRNVLDLVFTDYPHLQPIQEYLYSVIKCFLVGLKHHDWMQFHHISDRVVDPTITEEHIHESCIELIVDNPDCEYNKTPDSDCTLVTTDSACIDQRLLQQQALYRTNSCPDLAQGVSYMPQTSPTKIELDHTPPYSDDEEYISNKKAKQLTASTPIHKGTKPKHKGVTFNINEIISHPGVFTVPATNIIAAPGLQGQAQLNHYLTHAQQRLQNMAQPAPLHLQGADPALIAILNRMENKDSTHKKFLMFPKADFDSTSKQAAKSHWLNFQKYVAYQNSQNLLDSNDPNKFLEVKRMF